MMMLNMDFTQRVVINTGQTEWEQSPISGVMRKRLAREEKESGHATSLVRYDAGASFARHNHPLGEEILVLDGVFSDETGDFPAGSYIRIPPNSAHSPFSKEGCTLFVKRDQFAKDDQQTVRINTHKAPWLPGQGGLQVMPLHSYEGENTALVKWPAGEHFLPHQHYGGEEFLVLSGCFMDEQGEYPALSWVRNPHLSEHHPFVKEDTVIWVKTGHLPLDN